MGYKPRRPTISESFNAAMAQARAQGNDDIFNRVLFPAGVALNCAMNVPPEELTFEQWQEVYRVVAATRQFCDTLLPGLAEKLRIAETLSWVEGK